MQFSFFGFEVQVPGYFFNGLFGKNKKTIDDDALIALYEFNELAEYIKHDVDINPAAYESDSDTIQAAIINRQK